MSTKVHPSITLCRIVEPVQRCGTEGQGSADAGAGRG